MQHITLHFGDCKEVLLNLDVGAFICDPPYGLEFMGKGWDRLDLKGSDELCPQKMMQSWHYEWLNVAFESLRPGGVIKAFGGTRTFHRLAAAMEDAGFIDIHLEAWGYGSGFPKSKSLPLFIDKAAGASKNRGKALPVASTHLPSGRYATEKLVQTVVPPYTPITEDAKLWDGWGTALKPAWEPAVVGRKPSEGL